MIVQVELLEMTPGELLANLRESKKLSVAEVAVQLKLPVEKVELIEADLWEQFSPVFAVGYARQYGKLLGVTSPQLEAAIDSIDCSPAPMKSAFTDLGLQFTFRKSSRRTIIYIGLFACILIFMSLVYAYYKYNQQTSTPSTDNLLAPQAERPAEVAETAKRAIQPDSYLTSKAPNFIAEEEQDILSATPAPATTGHLEIELSAPSWLNIKDATGARLEFSLKPGGQLYEYHGEPPYQLQIGRAFAARVWLDGTVIELPVPSSGGVMNLTVASDSSSGNNYSPR